MSIQLAKTSKRGTIGEAAPKGGSCAPRGCGVSGVVEVQKPSETSVFQASQRESSGTGTPALGRVEWQGLVAPVHRPHAGLDSGQDSASNSRPNISPEMCPAQTIRPPIPRESGAKISMEAGAGTRVVERHRLSASGQHRNLPSISVTNIYMYIHTYTFPSLTASGPTSSAFQENYQKKEEANSLQQ